MSVIFGIRSRDEDAIDNVSLQRLAEVTARYGSDGTHLVRSDHIGMGFQAFHTHERSFLEVDREIDGHGNFAVLDGRIDNFVDLAEGLGKVPQHTSDSSLVLQLFAKLGAECFSRLIGEWACALWSAREHVLYLARDHAGSRTLYFRQDGDEITWSTYLHTFFSRGPVPTVDEAYVAKTISLHDVGNLTPYRGIREVPPAHYLMFKGSCVISKAHWSSIRSSTIRYKREQEYDEHFLHLFEQSVRRRIGSRAPILAELSGGVDSSSIVCVADRLAAREGATVVDTISYFDDTEPEWNEKPYFTLVEERRGLPGVHLDVSGGPSFVPLRTLDCSYPYLGADSSSLARSLRFQQAVKPKNHRVVLSGIGGDELLGGVPNPIPELTDLIVRLRWIRFLSKSTKWCLSTRQPLLYMIRDCIRYLARIYGNSTREPHVVAPWLSFALREVAMDSLPRPESGVSRFKAGPCATSNGDLWWMLLSTLPTRQPSLAGCFEYRLPYLDRDLVEFLHSIPREELVAPGRRRLLMRRALRGIVPNELLERKRKAVVSRAPLTSLRDGRLAIETLFERSLLAEHQYIDRKLMIEELHHTSSGNGQWIGHLHQTILAEIWLQTLAVQQTMPTL